MTEPNKKGNQWTGRATGAFRVFNWELFVKPRRWLMVGGALLMVGAIGVVLNDIQDAKKHNTRVQHNRRVQELAEEIKNRDNKLPPTGS